MCSKFIRLLIPIIIVEKSVEMPKFLILMILCILVLAGRVGKTVMTPIWLDYFEIINTPEYNISEGNTTQHKTTLLYKSYLLYREINVMAYLIYQFLFLAVFWGFSLLVLRIFGYKPIRAREKDFPFKYFVLMGFSQGLSSILVNYSSYGTRTPPYLIAILANLTIPSQFITR